MDAQGYASVAGVIITFLSAIGSVTVWLRGWRRDRKRLREEQRRRDRRARYKLKDACSKLREAEEARLARWKSDQSSLDLPQPQELEEEARELLLEALDLKPSKQLRADICFELGCLAHKRGELDEAERELSEALRLNSKLAHAYEERGLLRWMHDDLYHLEQALKDMEQAFELSPEGECEEIERRLQVWRHEISQRKEACDG